MKTENRDKKKYKRIGWIANGLGMRMPIVRNKCLPLGASYGAINLFGILFVKPGMKLDEETANHELIHSRQMRELLWIPFYLLYILEWFWRLIEYRGDTFKAYLNISFEREAYKHGKNQDYLLARQNFAMWRK